MMRSRKKPLVVGITGPTRSGKSWISKELVKSFDDIQVSNNAHKPTPPGGGKKVLVLGQDSFWRRAVKLESGVFSAEEPKCTDFDGFVKKIKEKIEELTINGGEGVLVVEGFQLLHGIRY